MNDMRDPLRWVYLYRPEDENSGIAAQAYRDARGLPYHHLLPCAGLGGAAVLNEAGYDSLKTMIQTYLLDHEMNTVKGLILGTGMPRYVEIAGRLCSLCSMLTQHASNDFDVVNPMYEPMMGNSNTLPVRELLPPAGMFLVMEMQGTASDELVQRADVLGVVAQDDTLVSMLRPKQDMIGVFQGDDSTIAEWASGEYARQLSLNLLETTVYGQSTQVFGPGAAGHLNNLELLESTQRLALWVDQRNGAMLEAGVGAAELDGPGLYASALGYAYSIGFIDTPHHSAWLDIRTLFSALRHGATMAEATWLCSPRAHHGLRVIGDPLRGPLYPLNRVEFWDADQERLVWVSPDVPEPSVQLQGEMPTGAGRLRVSRFDDHGMKSPDAILEVFTDTTGLTRLKVKPVSVARLRQFSSTQARMSWALTEQESYRWPERFELIDMRTGQSLAVIAADASQVFYTHMLDVSGLARSLWIGVRSTRGEDASPVVSSRLSMK